MELPGNLFNINQQNLLELSSDTLYFPLLNCWVMRIKTTASDGRSNLGVGTSCSGESPRGYGPDCTTARMIKVWDHP